MMSDKKFISQHYIPIYETFCNLPVPENTFSALIPTENDVKCSDPFDVINQLDHMPELGDYVLELIDADINEEPYCYQNANFGVGNSHPVIPEDPSQKIASIASSTADNKQPLPIPHTVEACSATTFPEWLVRPEAFDYTTHHLCTVEVQDFSAKRMKLLCMHVAEKASDCPNAISMKNSKKTVDSVSKSLKENTIPKVSQVVKPKVKQSSAMRKSCEERPTNPAKNAGVTLVNEKLWNHLYKLSQINVPVLGSSFQCDSNAPLKSRRKQTLLPRANAIVPTTLKLEPIAYEESVEEPVAFVPNDPSTEGADSVEAPEEQSLAISIEHASGNSSRVSRSQDNISSSTKKILHTRYGKQKKSGRVSLNHKNRKLVKKSRPGSSTQHQRHN